MTPITAQDNFLGAKALPFKKSASAADELGWNTLRCAHPSILVVTAHDVGEKATQRNFPDADAFVGKPFDIAALRRLVRKHLDLALSKAS